MTNRQGDWIQTYTGGQFWPLDPRPEEIDPRDIAHALSMMCRYAGHCLRFYSVAEHSILLSRVVKPENALWALLHDATEAYLVDVPRPVKPYLGGYYEAENKLSKVVAVRFGLSGDMPPEVKEYDTRILADECAQNMAPAPAPWNNPPKPLGVELSFWEPAQAKTEFLKRLKELT